MVTSVYTIDAGVIEFRRKLYCRDSGQVGLECIPDHIEDGVVLVGDGNFALRIVFVDIKIRFLFL